MLGLKSLVWICDDDGKGIVSRSGSGSLDELSWTEEEKKKG